MNRYIKGIIKNLSNPAVKFPALVDNISKISRLSKINRGVKIVDSTISKYSYVGTGSNIICADIGAFCSIACQVYIGLAGHTLSNLSTSPIFTEPSNGTGYSWTNSKAHAYHNKRTIVGNDVWIGHGSKIISGVTIGDGAVIAAGAVVTRDVSPYAIVGGIPAKIIRYRFEKNIIQRLLDFKWWNLDDDFLKGNISIFQSNYIDNELIDNILPPPHTRKVNLIYRSNFFSNDMKHNVTRERRVA